MDLREKFASVGIFTSTKGADGTAQRTTGRGPTSLAFYATSPRPTGKDVWMSKDQSRGGEKMLAIINRQLSSTDPETGEVTVEQVREYVDVLMPKRVKYGTGDHFLCIGTWTPGAQYQRADGTFGTFNDSFFVAEYHQTPKGIAVTALTVSEPVEVGHEVSDDTLVEAAAAPAAPARRRARK